MPINTAKRPSVYATGETGLGQLVKLSENTARMDFDGGGSFPLTFIFEEEGKNIPDYFRFKAMPINKKINVKITLTADNQGVAYINPANSEPKAKFVYFSGGEDGKVPAPKTKSGVDKYQKPYKPTSSATIEITNGVWKGCRLSFYLSYAVFGKAQDGSTLLYDGSNEKFTDLAFLKMRQFLTVNNVDLEAVPFSENILPALQAKILESNSEFKVLIENGWLNKVMGLDDDNSDWEDVETVTASTDSEGLDSDEEIGFTENQKANIHPALLD